MAIINKALLVLGKKGSGKTVFAEHLKAKGFIVYEMGEIVKKSMKEKDIELTNENLRAFMIKEREMHGWDVFAKYVIDNINGDMLAGKLKGHELIIIVGIRSVEEINYFSKFIKNALIIEIRADDNIRFNRVKERKKIAEPINYEQFLKQEEKEKQAGIEKALLMADIVIENNNDINTFKDKINHFIAMLNTD